ncbi:MAG: hypothetical protein HY711_05540 [Candidatus Melainabacteria bacterium]|nr:hypothetical protein [Candidatus Melainabacteria bacterium]
MMTKSCLSVDTHLVATEDGSLSYFDANIGELCHNRAGAYTEALKNYIEPSEAFKTLQSKKTLTVLDACFGLGYNTWVLLESVLENMPQGCQIKVVAIENNPAMILLSPMILQDPRLQQTAQLLLPVFDSQQSCLLVKPIKISLKNETTVQLDLIQSDLRDTVPRLAEPCDLILHDPFSTNKMPELWTVNLFQQYYRLLEQYQGKLLTYSAASAVRGGLLEAGFTVWRTAAVGGKSGGTLASYHHYTSTHPAIYPLTQDELARMRTKSGIPYRDQNFSLSKKEILIKRKAEQDLQKH